MRKIDKSTILATAYHTWVNALEAERENHGVYNSSKNEYYKDVVMNLLYCQRGVCAYTEMFLFDVDYCSEQYWQNGRYIGTKKSKGQLEHFNPELKKNKAWLWNNLFVVDTDTNTKIKGRKQTNIILKPDHPDYNPFDLLTYNPEEHIFRASDKVQESAKVEAIDKMILTLGLNWDAVIDARKKYLNELFTQVKLGFKTVEEVKPYQFFTAFEMSKPFLSNNKQ